MNGAQRLQQLADNGIRQVREEQELESKQSELFGLNVPNRSWRDEIAVAETFWLSPIAAAQCCVTTYLAKRLGSDLDHLLGDKPLKTLRLSHDARGLLLDDYKRLPRSVEPIAREWEKWLKGSQPTLSVTFEQETSVENAKTTHLSVLHPLVRQAAHFLEIVQPQYLAVAMQSSEVPPGTHHFALYRWAKHGIKPDEMLVAVADDPRLEASLFAFLQSANDAGSDYIMLATPAEYEALDARHHARWAEAQATHIEENRQLIEHRGQSLTVSHRARRKAIEDQIARATNDKIRLMKESELARANADFDRRMTEIRQAENHSDIVATPVLFGTKLR